MSAAKVAEPIEMPFGLLTWVCPGNDVLDVVQIPPGKDKFWAEESQPIVKCRGTPYCELCKNG